MTSELEQARLVYKRLHHGNDFLEDLKNRPSGIDEDMMELELEELRVWLLAVCPKGAAFYFGEGEKK